MWLVQPGFSPSRNEPMKNFFKSLRKEVSANILSIWPLTAIPAGCNGMVQASIGSDHRLIPGINLISPPMGMTSVSHLSEILGQLCSCSEVRYLHMG